MDPLRQQILQLWSHMVTSDQPTRLEMTNKYRTKKIMLRVHGHMYYDIVFESQHQALSHEIVELENSQPLEDIFTAPQMIGMLGALAEVKGEIAAVEEEAKPEEKMEEDMFFEQHFTQSLSEALGNARQIP